MADSKVLNIKLGHIKAKLTTFKTFLEKFISEQIKDSCQLKIRTENISDVLSKYEELHMELLLLSDEKDYPSLYSEFELFSNKYFNIMELTKNTLDILESSSSGSNPLLNGSVHSHTSNISNHSLNENHQNIQIRLPEIQLPTFSGNIRDWLGYYDLFRSLIDDNDCLSDIQKYHYLINSLQGDAKLIIQSLEVSERNYVCAFELLKERYQNNTLLADAHLDSLLNLPSIAKDFTIRQLLDQINKHTTALESLGKNVQDWSYLLLHLLSKKLDYPSRREYENYISKLEDEPNLSDFKKCLSNRAQLLEKLDSRLSEGAIKFNSNENKNKYYKNNKQSNTLTTTYDNKLLNQSACIICKENHNIFLCPQFNKLTPSLRYQEIKKRNLCVNCFKVGHGANHCLSQYTCKLCQKRHHTLLCFSKSADLDATQNHNNNHGHNIEVRPSAPPLNIIDKSLTSVNKMLTTQILLPTAMVSVQSLCGKSKCVRALLDSGSMSNFITKSLCDELGLTFKSIHHPVNGINQTQTLINSSADIKILNQHKDYSITCLVVPTITGQVPNFTFNAKNLNIPKHIKLADPTFYNAGKIDILIGCTLFFELLCSGQIRLNNTLPILQNTQLGWILSGPINYSNANQTNHCLLSNIDLNNQLKKFWEVDEFNNIGSFSENDAEKHFIANIKRSTNGRFIAKYPLKNNKSFDDLGLSKQGAISQFKSLENKLDLNPNLKQLYCEFMHDYIDLGHMTKVNDVQDVPSYYLPHHGVLKSQSTTSKLRVVFNGSSPTTSGISLNDLLQVGPTIQDDLTSILIKFREYPYVVSADIAKMYRQIDIHPSQRQFQRIVWRDDRSLPINTYELCTVTYGLASSAYLAIRCLHQLAIDHAEINPIASKIITSCFYVDDLLASFPTVQEAKARCLEIINILSKGQFQLRKFSSNSSEILNALTETNTDPHIIECGGTAKTLGLIWHSSDDTLSYKIHFDAELHNITKREILSKVSQIFDPLGLLGPGTIIGRIIIQKIWQLKLDWDTTVPEEIALQWLDFKKSLTHLNNIKIPRYVGCEAYTCIQLHGFCDSSKLAMGANIYLHATDASGNITVNLLCSKSRVAPLKTMTIPRLELSAAVLLANLIQKVLTSLKIKISKTYLWCDSTIVLYWIKTSADALKPFVAHRVSQIQALTKEHEWRHVPTSTNPADLVSRGLRGDQLLKSDLWWKGPPWLSQNESLYPPNITLDADISEMRKSQPLCTLANVETFNLFERYSSFTKLQRITALVLRFIQNAQNKTNKTSGFITTFELQNATICLVKIMQKSSFPDELKLLIQSKPINTRSSLLRLHPFTDNNGIIRVGGRIKNASINYNHKNPIVLDSKHILTNLIIINEHKKLLHAGPQATLFSIRQRFWPISGFRLVKKLIMRCMTCFRCNPPVISYEMGDLPYHRVNKSKAFHAVGVDYAGPYNVKENTGRGRRIIKSYLCIFVCLSTKAVHLELATNLSTDAFINSLKRFISRRGKPSIIYSDNGTNFIGTKNELENLLKSSKHKNKINDFLNQDSISWNFIPPRAPNFGGLWEAAVKSCKHHLKRTIGDANLTFEELYTILTQVESCLNSRPLTPLSSDPTDLNPLTPGHFLIGQPLTSLPQPNYADCKETLLNRYERCQNILQHFWIRWQKEYLSQLQFRNKKTSSPTIQEGMMVLLREENTPPQHWHIGRIHQLHPGSDGICRVVSVKTQRGIIKRAITKLSVLPIEL